MTLLFIYLAIAIGVSFLCSILEAVLLSTTPSYVENLNSEKPRSGAIVTRVRERLDESISSILILNTFAHTMGAVGVGSQAVQMYGVKCEALIAVLLTLVILYFSEIIPKTLGATYCRRLAVPSDFVILWLAKLAYPLVWIATRLTKLLGSGRGDEVTREEIIAMASLGKKGGALVARENECLSNMLSLREVPTEEVLTPRTVVHMLDQMQTVSEALDDPKTVQFARIPIYGEGIDDITGKVLRNDLFVAERAGHGKEPIKDYLKEILRVSEKLPVHLLLDQFIKNRVHL
tara:strand:+ start:2958 stop:3827 length:870 start_codon:yes stop_codon:yes gene_type:complete